MEIRYLGFDQTQSFRVYKFDVRISGHQAKQASVTADLAVFHNYKVALQEGPSLCEHKLTADLARGWEGDHELNAADLRAYSDAKNLADARRLASRKAYRRPPPH